MTDILAGGTAPSRRIDVSSERAKARIRARYRAETRMKAYGLTALTITTLFLAGLFFDIIRNAIPAFTAYSIEIDVPVAAEAVAANGKVDEAAIRSADYYPILRDAVRGVLPGVDGRSAERKLTGLLSTGAADPLRARLVADPSLVGTTVKQRLLFSADADIYLRGAVTKVMKRPGSSAATPSATSGEITIVAASSDFAEELAAVKRSLALKAQSLKQETARIGRASTAQTQTRLDELEKEIADLTTRHTNAQSAEALDSSLPSVLVAINGGLVKINKLDGRTATGDVILPLTSTTEAAPGSWSIRTYATPEANRKITDQEVAYLEALKETGNVTRHFNWTFLTSGDSREPELAGVRGALTGTALTLLVTLVLCLPIGVAAAIYLEEFAPKNRITELIEVNINNLAAVPSIVFGLLGLAVFLNFFGLPRSAPLVGGLVLALLVLPTIIIASRAALKAVPPSIKEAALGVGASHQQAVFHHVLPLAMPGIMTGTIIGMAHALGETAPLLMIGMVAFIVDVPGGITEAATVLPVQIYLWSDLPEQAFQYRTAGAILVLLLFLFLMNGLAIWLRRKFERRW